MINKDEIRNWRWIPFERIVIESSKTKAEIISLLNFYVGPEKNVLNFPKHFNYSKEYEGEVYYEGFKISRRTSLGYNGFKPLAFGKIKNTNNNMFRIEITIRPHIILLVLLALSVLVLLISLFSAFSFGSLMIFGVPYLISVVFYNLDRYSMKSDLFEKLQS